MRRLTSENKERKYKMAKILISPSKYLQGAGEMKNLGTYAAKSGKKALVLISKGGYKRTSWTEQGRSTWTGRSSPRQAGTAGRKLTWPQTAIA